MTTTIYPNGIKVHCVWQDGTHMKEGEKIPLEVQKKAVQSVLKMIKEETDSCSVMQKKSDIASN
ncbi:hypothetical protein [Enterococcus gallinarum]|uniref:hypothetical protein n=1 Tax=Enterococcus gallinarum TaxID=1353 RepID=UPI0029558861|nr:hypothetical protein [Enterococcus gallinarum]MDV7740849.1 hypothetical protein [Enterococcus gallinarum]